MRHIAGWRIGSLFLLTLSLVVPAHSLSTAIPYAENPGIVVDGIILDYTDTFYDSTTNMTVYWVHNGTHLFIGLVSQGTGWLAIGFGPTGTGMDGSNILIGYVEGDTATVIDEVGVGRNHFPDTSRGGRDDVQMAAGTVNEETVIEFVIPLSSGDPLDTDLQQNRTYGFFLAYQKSNIDLSAFHTAFSETHDVMIAPSPTVAEPPPSIEWISVIILAALALLVSGLVVYRFIKRPKVYRFSEMEHG